MQKKFKELMEILVGRPLGVKLSDEIGALQDDCLNWQKNPSKDKRLVVAAETGYEPCPLNYSGGSNPAKMAMIGINPGKPMEEWMYMDDNTTWQEIAEFYAPLKGILANKNNAYYFLSKKSIKSDFYRDLLLIHQALLGNAEKIFDKFSDARDYYGVDKIEEVFMEQLAKYPVLCSDIIPYKSVKADINYKEMMVNSHYRDYLNSMLELTIDSTEKNAYIVFYGNIKNVKGLLSKVASKYFPSNIWCEYMLGSPTNKEKKTSVYLAHWHDERIVALVPSRAQGSTYTIPELAEKINKFRSEKV